MFIYIVFLCWARLNCCDAVLTCTGWNFDLRLVAKGEKNNIERCLPMTAILSLRGFDKRRYHGANVKCFAPGYRECCQGSKI